MGGFAIYAGLIALWFMVAYSGAFANVLELAVRRQREPVFPESSPIEMALDLRYSNKSTASYEFEANAFLAALALAGIHDYDTFLPGIIFAVYAFKGLWQYIHNSYWIFRLEWWEKELSTSNT